MTYPMHTQPKPKKSNPPLIVAIIGFLVVIAVCSGVVMLAGSGGGSQPADTNTSPASLVCSDRDLGCGTPNAPCSTDRLGKYFEKDGSVYTCTTPKPYQWRKA